MALKLLPYAVMLGLGLFGVKGAKAEGCADSDIKCRLAVLETKDKIRSLIDTYSLLVDGGDGKWDRDKWAETFFTKDAVSRAYLWDGSLASEVRGRQTIRSGLIYKDGKSTTKAKRHFLINVAFDEITPAQVKTRTTAVVIEATRTKADTSPGGMLSGSAPLRTAMLVYHDTWVIEDGAWKKSPCEVYYDTGPSK
jgi:hypothetical protein